MTAVHAPAFVTGRPWHLPRKRRYGAVDTYGLAAAWLQDCPTVADWGGGAGWFRTFLPPTVAYTLVDGTQQAEGQVLADLDTYHEPSDGILLRHVVDNTPHGLAILRNALAAFRHRLVVITYTPGAAVSAIAHDDHGWPVWHLNHEELMDAMGDWLVRFEFVPTTQPERVYYVERR